jgi:ankyrin repeat protein
MFPSSVTGARANTVSCRQLRRRIQNKLDQVENRRKTGQDLTRQIIRSTSIMSSDGQGSAQLTSDPHEPMGNDQFIDSSDQNLSSTSGMHFDANFENTPMELDFSEGGWLSTPWGSLGTVHAPTRYGASSDLLTLNPSFLSTNFTNNPDEMFNFNHNLSIPNPFDTPRPSAISDNLTTQAVALSLGASPSPSNSDMSRTIVISEEENIQKIRDVTLQMIQNNLLTGSTIDTKSLQILKFIPPTAAKHILPENFNDPRYLETAQKTFWLLIRVRNCGLILAFLQLGLLSTINMINAAYELAMKCQDLDLVKYLVAESDIDLSTYDPFADSIIHDHFPDIGVEDTSDPWETWHRARHEGAFYVSSLEFASMQQNPSLVQLLLQNKTDAKTRPSNHSKHEALFDSCPINPLYSAISGKIPTGKSKANPGIVLDSEISQNIVQILIEAGADVDFGEYFLSGYERRYRLGRQTESEFTPICIAASQGEVKIVEYLLENNAQIKKGSPGELALLRLLKNSSHINGSDLSRIAKMLINSGIDIHLEEDCDDLHQSKHELNSYKRNAIDLAYQFDQPEIISLLHDKGAVPGERTLLYAIKGANSNSIHDIFGSGVTSENFIPAILEALVQKTPDIVLLVLSFTRAKYGHDLEKFLVEEDDISDLMESITEAIELEYKDITCQLISIAEALPSMPGMLSHFQATCRAAENDWSSKFAHNLFKVAKYPKNIWDMKDEDWLKLCTRTQSGSSQRPWNWNYSFIKVLLDAKIYPLSSETMTIAILICARDGVEELVKRLFNIASEELLIDVPASNEQIQEFMRTYGERGYYMEDKYPSLSDTVSAGHFKITELLLRNGFTVDYAAFDGVLQKGNFNLFDQFLCVYTGCRREIYLHKNSIPILCAEDGKLLLDNRLLSAHNGIFINPVPITEWVISNGSLNLLIKILGGFSGHDVASSDSLLDAAVELRKHEMLEVILHTFKERGNIPTEEFGQTALKRAVEGADIKSTSLLLAFGVCPFTLHKSVTGQSSALSFVIEEHSPNGQAILPVILGFIRDIGNIVEERDGIFNTAIHTAVASDNLDAVELLIHSGFQVNHRPTRRTPRTPLQAACACSSLAMIHFLLNKGADINAPAFIFRGGTALHLAVIRGDVEIVKDLLDRNVDSNAPGATVGGRTAVEAAAEHGRVHILESYLLRRKPWDGEFGERQYRRACKLADNNGRRTAKFILEISWMARGRLLQSDNNNVAGVMNAP